MTWLFTPYLIPLSIAAVLSLGLAVYGARRRGVAGASAFVLMMSALTLWSITYALELGNTELSNKIFWLKAEYPGIVLLPVFWLVFSLQYSNSQIWRKYGRRVLVLLLIVPITTVILAWTNEWHHLIWQRIELNAGGSTSILELTYGRWFWIHVTVSYLYLIWGTGIVVNMVFRTRTVYRRQAVVILLGALIPWFGNVLYVFGPNPVSGLDLTPFSFTLTGSVLAWSVFRYRLLHLMPVALRVVFDGMDDGVIVLDSSNRVVDVNPGAQYMLGISRLTDIGRDAGDVLSSWPEQVERFREVMHTRTEVSLEIEGELRHFSLYISPLSSEDDPSEGRVLVLRNVTERKRAESHKERQLLFSRALNRIGDAVITQSDRQSLLDTLAGVMGEALEVDRSSIYEIRFADEVVEGLCEWLNPDHPDIAATKATYPLSAFEAGATEMRRTKHWMESHFDNRNPVLVADGSAAVLHESMSVRSLLWYPFAFRDYGYYALIFNQVEFDREWQQEELTFLDAATRQINLALQKLSLIQDREKTGGELTKSNQHLSDTLTELQSAQERLVQRERLAAVGQLAAGVAHDFNNILTGIIGYADLLKTAPDVPDDVREDLGRIKTSGRQAARLVEQLLDFSRQSFRKPRTIDLIPYLEEVVEFLRRIVPENIHLNLEHEASRMWIHADDTQLQQLMTNLVLNAKDAMPDGGRIKLSVEHRSMNGDAVCAISQEQIEGEWIVLKVSDTGSGIPPEVLPRVLEPFYTTKVVGAGSGMGLSQVAGIVSQHEGHLTVESDVGSGTTISIFLPPSSGEHHSEDVGDPGRLTAGEGRTILLVEDNPTARDVSRAMLLRLGYNVLIANNGVEALSLYSDREQEIAAVLSDVVMPEMDGIELFTALHELNPDVRMVLMSGYLLEEKRVHLLESGVAAWLQKPMSLHAMSDAVAGVSGAG
jgi:PAS domain S-box-containing protein